MKQGQERAGRSLPAGVDADDRPTPLHTTVATSDPEPGVGAQTRTTVFRVWAREDALNCRLCLECTAQPGPAAVDHEGRRCRTRVCVLEVPGELDPGLAPLLSADGLR